MESTAVATARTDLMNVKKRTGRKLALHACDDWYQTTQSVFETALALKCFIAHYGK
jgi:hypothetical protein